MLILLPIGLFLAAALAILIQDRLRPHYGTSWLIAAGASIAAWLSVIVFRLRLPTNLFLYDWKNPEFVLIGQFSFLLDYASWPYVLALTTVTLAVILTGAARTRYDSTPRSWTVSLMITGLGLASLQSGSSLMLMFSWVLVDLLELFYLLRLVNTQDSIQRIIISYGVRTSSILVLLLATSVGWRAAPNFPLTQIPPDAAFLFLLAAGLRLGVFPLNMPILQEPGLRRGAGNVIRLAPVASSLMLLARLPADVLSPALTEWAWVFHGLLAIAALYAAFRWLYTTDEIKGRPFWIVAWAALATEAVINGQPQASIPFGLALILTGSLLFLYFPRVQRMNFLLYFGLIGLLGWPFTPLASGWVGLGGFSLWSLLFIVAHAVILLGYVNRLLRPGGEVGALESWARIVYPLGLIWIIQTIVALGLVGWPGSLTLGQWWMPLISALIVSGAFIVLRKTGLSSALNQLPASSRLAVTLNWIIPRIEPVFRLEWIFQVAWRIYQVMGRILKSITTLLEGQGGVLWTIVLLVLLLALLMGGRSI